MCGKKKETGEGRGHSKKNNLVWEKKNNGRIGTNLVVA